MKLSAKIFRILTSGTGDANWRYICYLDLVALVFAGAEHYVQLC